MSMNDYIPVGRTSLVKKKDLAIQVQTEYAPRPNPRITTSISQSGRMIHKVERTLENPVNSQEEQKRVQAHLLRQHTEVVAIIESDSFAPGSAGALMPANTEERSNVSEPDAPVKTKRQALHEKLSGIPGVQNVFRVDNDGTFIAGEVSEQFRKAFGGVFRNLYELLELFDRGPGVGITRAMGVYEVERDRLYLLSSGTACYFVVVRRVDPHTKYEQALRGALNSHA